MSSYKTLRPGERIYGLGERTDQSTELEAGSECGTAISPAMTFMKIHCTKSIPFFISSAGYSIFFDNTYKTEYDFGVEA